MTPSDLKTKINTIDNLLKTVFQEVSITEKVNKNRFFFLIESKKPNEFLFEIDKNSLLNENFHWNYYTNPCDLSSHTIERTSSLKTLISDITDIRENKRFDETYLKMIN